MDKDLVKLSALVPLWFLQTKTNVMLLPLLNHYDTKSPRNTKKSRHYDRNKEGSVFEIKDKTDSARLGQWVISRFDFHTKVRANIESF